MSRYHFTIALESDNPDDDFVLRSKAVLVLADTKEQAIALLDSEASKAWASIKQQVLVDAVENPDITNGIELK